jgi:pimeloyl-ACP methyl ester carboxylesterase
MFDKMKGENLFVQSANQASDHGVEGTPGLLVHQLSVCGGPVYVYEAGEKSRPAVVLLHGAMYDESRFSWDSMFPALSRRYHVFAVDTPRHGKSRPWEGELDRARLSGILAGTLSALRLTRFSIVGLSMGGSLAIEYAAAHPDEVVSMALFEPGGLADTVEMQLVSWLYIKIPGTLRLLSRFYHRYDDAKLQKLVQSLFTKGTAPDDLARLAAIIRDEINGKFTYGERDMDDWQLSAMAPFRLKWNLLKQIETIQCQTLWLRGAESKLVKQREMERAVLLAQTGGAKAELTLIPHAGHMLPLEQPEQANVAVTAFLETATV